MTILQKYTPQANAAGAAPTTKEQFSQMKKSTWFEVVRVVSRHPKGPMREWYDGDEKFGLYSQASKELDRLAAEFPGVEYALVERSVTEFKPKKG